MLLMALQHLLEQLDLHFIMGFGLMMDGNYLLGFILSQAICDNMMSTALLNSNKGHHPQHSEKKRTKLFYSFVFKNDILQTACIFISNNLTDVSRSGSIQQITLKYF